MIALVHTHSPPAAERATTAARAGLALIALDVADEAFLRTEPGVSAADHLASGLVPLAVAGLVAYLYPRVRPGARATAALACGALALAAGAVGETLSLIGGVLLVAAGAHALWRSRKAGGHRLLRRAGIAGLAAVVATFVVLPAGLAVVGTQKPRTVAERADLGAPYREVTLRTRDGLRLAAWYVPSRNGAAVIAFPGRRQPVPHARMLVRHGYGVLLLDRRGEGESDGDVNRYGWGTGADLDAAVDFLAARERRVGGLGLSVGGELLLEAQARRPELAAVVSEGAGIRSLREQLHNPDAPKALRMFSPWTVQTLAMAVLSNTGPPPDLAETARGPALLIQAERPGGGEEMNAVYAERAGERWVAPGGHTGAIGAAPREYERRVIAFLDRTLRGDG